MGIIGTVLRRFPGAPVDKDKIAHDQPGDCPRSPVDIFQCLREQRRFLLPRALVLDFFQNFIGPICQRDGAIALLRFRRSCTPKVLLVAVLQGFVDRQRPILEIYRIPRQSDHLAGAQTGFKDQRVLIVVVGAFCNFKKSSTTNL